MGVIFIMLVLVYFIVVLLITSCLNYFTEYLSGYRSGKPLSYYVYMNLFGIFTSFLAMYHLHKLNLL